MSNIDMTHTEQWQAYKKIVADNVFDCIDVTSSVLEIGPFDGWFTDCILEKNPKYVQLIEPNALAYSKLLSKYARHSNIDIRNLDVFEALNIYTKKFDVVIAFGVMYHWHNPFEFLEQVVNFVKPIYFCLDNPDPDQIYISKEEINVPGNRQVSPIRRSVNLSLAVPSQYIETAMTDLNYTTKFVRSMKDINLQNKNDFSIWKFKLNDTVC